MKVWLTESVNHEYDYLSNRPQVSMVYRLPKDLERSRLTTIFIKMTTHLNLNLQDMFRSFNDHLQLKVELI